MAPLSATLHDVIKVPAVSEEDILVNSGNKIEATQDICLTETCGLRLALHTSNHSQYCPEDIHLKLSQ